MFDPDYTSIGDQSPEELARGITRMIRGMIIYFLLIVGVIIWKLLHW